MQLFGLFYFGAALLALLLLLPALENLNFKPFGDWQPKTGPWRSTLWDLVTSELGAVSVTYYIRGSMTLVNGSTTAPTAAQAGQVMKQSAVVVFGVVADVQALFTHNWGLDGSGPTYFEPEVLIEPISSGTSWPLITFWRANTNVLTINKLVGDAATTVLVTLRRPHSIGQ
jgi:hypothetical protein